MPTQKCGLKYMLHWNMNFPKYNLIDYQQVTGGDG